MLDFFNALGNNFQKDMDSMLQLLEKVAQSGPPRNVEVSHKIQDDIWEFIKGRLRVCWFYDAGRVIVCTHGFVKRTQKIPKREIKRASKAREAYMEAAKNGDLIITEEDDG